MSDEDLIQTFIEETRENLETLEEGLLELERVPDDAQQMDEVFRAMHTIKGGAGLMGFTGISAVAHRLENILDMFRRSGKGLTEDTFGLLLSGTDVIKQMLQSEDTSGESIGEPLEELLTALKVYEENLGLASADSSPEQAGQEPQQTQTRFYKIELKFNQDIFETGTDPLMLLLELEESGTILESHVNVSNLPPLQQLEPHSLNVFWTIFFESDKSQEEIDDIFIFVRDENDVSVEDITEEKELWFQGEKRMGELLVERGLISPDDVEEVLQKQKRVGELLIEEGKLTKGQVEKVVQTQQKYREQEQTNTIRVDTHKLEEILNNIAELLIAQSRVKELVVNLASEDRSATVEVLNAFQEVDKIIRFLQEEVMNTSMIPIGGTFMRFQRMVRDLARENGKEIELVMQGKETELDKKVIEQIADPLKHLIRNCVDHGLETPEEREKAGKPRQGTIWLNAYHQEGNIVIEISDDGRGIDESRVLEKAQSRGLVDPDRTLSRSEIQRLLFMPGFSTAKEVTDISGRGVGLDVVMTNITNLRGSVDLQSEQGRGTTFSIKLPLTLAIIDGMMVRVGEERFIIPLTSITEFIKARPQDIRQVEGKGLIVHLRKEYIPYTGLFQLLDIEAEYTKPTEGILVIIKEGRKKLAVLVDEIIGQEQVVIKSMKENMEQIDGIAGATILGDGKVAIILDISSLFRLARTKDVSHKTQVMQ